MIYATPGLDGNDTAVLDLIGKQREKLRSYTQSNPRRWFGSLRRTTFARAIQGSNSIEGYHATMDDAIAAIEDEPPLDERTETWYAIRGYRNALTYIMQAAQDPYFEFGKQFLKSLHFMMLGHDMGKRPGQWRSAPVFVVNSRTGDTVYEAPETDAVDELIQELIATLNEKNDVVPMVRAAMSHLNLTMIHPFKDGNGRMARAIQTLVLSRDGFLHPVFSSIEEWLGRNTQEYYDILALTGKGIWNPERDALPWVRFCLKAHYQQAATLVRRNEEYESLFAGIQAIVARESLHERMAVPMFDAALGVRITNSRYRVETDVTDFTASRDLKRLCDLDLLEPKGEKRTRTYSAAKELMDLRTSVRIRLPVNDPYDLVGRKKRATQAFVEPRLPGI